MYSIYNIGCPIILNQNKTYLDTIVKKEIELESIDPSCLWSINQIYTIFSKNNSLKNNTYRCEMIDWCKMSFLKKNVDDLTSKDDKCYNAPWERASNTEDTKYCAFAQIWFSWGMKDVKPISG